MNGNKEAESLTFRRGSEVSPGEICQVMEAPEDKHGNMLAMSAFQYCRSIHTRLAFSCFCTPGPFGDVVPLLTCWIGSRVGQH